MSRMSGHGDESASRQLNDVTQCSSQPLKPAKKYRSESDNDKQIVRCKRKLDFIGDVDGVARGRLGRGGCGSSARRASSVARRNERERKRVSLINRTFEILRDQLPVSLWGHRNLAKVSKVETLRAAIGYIRSLEDILAEDEDEGNEGEQLVEMLNSAERLASLAAGSSSSIISSGSGVCDQGLSDVCHGTEMNATPFSTPFTPSSLQAIDTASSACERLEYLSSTQVDIHGATRRLACLTAPVQHPRFCSSHDVTDLPHPHAADSHSDDSSMLDINSNYDNFRELSTLKPGDDDVINQLIIASNFTFDVDDFTASVGS